MTATGYGHTDYYAFLKGVLQTWYAKFLAVRGVFICVIKRESRVHGKITISKQQVVAHKKPAVINNICIQYK